MNAAKLPKYSVKHVGSFTPLHMNKSGCLLNAKGQGNSCSSKYVNGTNIIKKANFAKHLLFENHKKATLRCKEKELMAAAAKSTSSEDTQTSSSGVPKQTLLRPMVQKINAAQRLQLGRKFQLAHFTSLNAKSFKTYADFAAFEKQYHNAVHYKNLWQGQPTFNVISLEEPEECNAQGIKQAMENSLSKMNINFQRKDKEIGMCSDGASVNRAVYNLLVEEFGDHYLLMLCPSHKFELAINDAFGSSLLNNATENDYTEVYYFFKKSPLRWRLFKRQSLFMGTPCKKVQEAYWHQMGGASCRCTGFIP